MISLLLLLSGDLTAQSLLPGFDAKEYAALLTLNFNFDKPADSTIPGPPPPFRRVYDSGEKGLMNRWNLWTRDDSTAVISIRGTVPHFKSWLDNFYAAMLPATGSLRLNDSTEFNYQLSSNPAATVHAGWLLALASLGPDMIREIRLWHDKGIRSFYIIGHSQGGAIAFLTRSYLYYAQKKGTIPSDLRFKTYCSAAPKPGNLYYAYDYDYITRGGWAFNVVNAADWVPELPFSVQTTDDFNPTNPFRILHYVLRKQPLPIRIYGNIIYRKMSRPTKRARRRFTKFLGHKMYKQLRKQLPGFPEPAYALSNNYARAGNAIVLMPDSAYHTVYPEPTADSLQQGKGLFRHHLYGAYIFLLKRQFDAAAVSAGQGILKKEGD